MLPKTGFQKPTETSQDRAGDSRSTKTDSRSTVVSKGRELPQPECVSTQPRSIEDTFAVTRAALKRWGACTISGIRQAFSK